MTLSVICDSTNMYGSSTTPWGAVIGFNSFTNCFVLTIAESGAGNVWTGCSPTLLGAYVQSCSAPPCSANANVFTVNVGQV